MKLSTLMVILLILSCRSTPSINYDLIIGSWTSEYGADSIFEAFDITTFTANDSVVAEASIKGERSRIFAAKYSINKDDGTLIIKTDSFESTSRIIDLTSQTMILQIHNPRAKWRLKKLL